ncbi:MAG: hypothetical protein QOJ49_620, partial [Actinomycetota bacterium]|nr:hypothetical protein [Actinomycetota bacterium]
MPEQEQHVDVVVIGMGPGAEEVAGRLAEAGLTVVGLERELVGGECPYWGCIPSKMMIRGSNLLAEAGLNVVGLDPRLVGGECPYWGCIPSKMMIRAANL